MSGCFSHSLKWAASVVAATLVGCSIHPIPDDVSRYDTADIVRNVRCEAKEAVRERIQQALYERGIYDADPEKVLKDPALFERIRRRDPRLATKFKAYGATTISYAFLFDITENNNNSGNVNFNMPFTPPGGSLSLLLNGQFNKTRHGVRQFGSTEKFQDLGSI
jgi:hypothetical protein